MLTVYYTGLHCVCRARTWDIPGYPVVFGCQNHAKMAGIGGILGDFQVENCGFHSQNRVKIFWQAAVVRGYSQMFHHVLTIFSSDHATIFPKHSHTHTAAHPSIFTISHSPCVIYMCVYHAQHCHYSLKADLACVLQRGIWCSSYSGVFGQLSPDSYSGVFVYVHACTSVY